MRLARPKRKSDNQDKASKILLIIATVELITKVVELINKLTE